MSRSNPNENNNPSPATRWFEWNGELGIVRYYDKDAKKNVDVGSDFTFILLDALGCVRGWHDASDSGIYSNEVKDTTQETLIVKAFKGGVLIEGIYRDIKDRVNALGGQYVSALYIAFKNSTEGLQIGVLRLKGAALGAWMEFAKANRANLYKQSIRINGYSEGKKGRIVFRVPVLSLKAISPDTDRVALGLDKVLQEYLSAYLKRPKREQVEEPPHDAGDDYVDVSNELHDVQPEPITNDLMDDDIPFAWVLPFVLPLTGALSLLTLA